MVELVVHVNFHPVALFQLRFLRLVDMVFLARRSASSFHVIGGLTINLSDTYPTA